MDWMEKLFGFSPDGGDGRFELSFAIALTLAAAVTAVVWLRRARASYRGRPDRPAT